MTTTSTAVTTATAVTSANTVTTTSATVTTSSKTDTKNMEAKHPVCNMQAEEGEEAFRKNKVEEKGAKECMEKNEVFEI